MGKIRTTAAATLLAASMLGGVAAMTAPAAQAATHVQAKRCSVGWTWQIKSGSGGWLDAIVSHSCSGVGVYAKALCKETPTIGKNVYSGTLYGDGTTRAQCPSNYQVSAGWVYVGATQHKVYP